MARKSRKKLADALKEMNLIPLEYDPKRFANEVYGKDARVYLHVAEDEADRRRIEKALTDRGFSVSADYYPGSKVIEVLVTYFKGFHWDE